MVVWGKKMSRTTHHRNQKHSHCGYDYGSKYKCNKNYAQSYGVDGRNRADSERRQQDKKVVADELSIMDCEDDYPDIYSIETDGE